MRVEWGGGYAYLIQARLTFALERDMSCTDIEMEDRSVLVRFLNAKVRYGIVLYVYLKNRG